jgi:two-component system chemotaxis response regulator CheY
VSPSSQKTILVVDDDTTSRAVVVKVIESRSHRVVEAASGAEAIAVCQRGTPINLLVLDVIMAEMDGFETLERIRQLGFNATPVIMLTGQTRDEQMIAGYQAGVDYYLTKPFKPEALVNIVDYLIGDLSPEENLSCCTSGDQHTDETEPSAGVLSRTGKKTRNTENGLLARSGRVLTACSQRGFGTGSYRCRRVMPRTLRIVPWGRIVRREVRCRP